MIKAPPVALIMGDGQAGGVCTHKYRYLSVTPHMVAQLSLTQAPHCNTHSLPGFCRNQGQVVQKHIHVSKNPIHINKHSDLHTCWGWRSQIIVFMLFKISSINGITSPTWTCTKCLRHFWAILMNVSQAMSWTPSWVSNKIKTFTYFLFNKIMKIKLSTMSKWDLPCMNSNSLFTTVFKNFQCALKNLGYWPTMYMIFDAIIALLSLPLFCSHNPKRSCKIRQTYLWCSMFHG